MTMRDGSPAAFAPRRPSAQAGHLGRRPGLVDEDRALRIEVELPLEPGLAPLHDVGPILLGGMRRLFLNVMPRRSKKRQTVPRATPSPRSCRSFSASSASVMSGLADTWLRMNAASASIRPDRRSPPSFRGAHEPSRRSNCHQRIALRRADPKPLRRLAARHSTRDRRCRHRPAFIDDPLHQQDSTMDRQAGILVHVHPVLRRCWSFDTSASTFRTGWTT